MRARTRLIIAFWVAVNFLGIILVARADRASDAVPVAIILVLLIALAATLDHLITIRENRR